MKDSSVPEKNTVVSAALMYMATVLFTGDGSWCEPFRQRVNFHRPFWLLIWMAKELHLLRMSLIAEMVDEAKVSNNANSVAIGLRWLDDQWEVRSSSDWETGSYTGPGDWKPYTQELSDSPDSDEELKIVRFFFSNPQGPAC